MLQGQEDLQNQVSDVHSSITTVQNRLQDMEQSFLLKPGLCQSRHPPAVQVRHLHQPRISES